MKRFVAMICTAITVIGVWLATPEPKAMAYPPRGEGTDCSPTNIWPLNGGSGFYNLTKSYANGLWGFNIQGAWAWTCSPPATSYSYTCAPCYKVDLWRNLAYPNGQDWAPMMIPESDFQIQNQPSGTCQSGGTWYGSFTKGNLAPGQYEIRIEFGAGDDRRCYTLITSWQQFTLP